MPWRLQTSYSAIAQTQYLDSRQPHGNLTPGKIYSLLVHADMRDEHRYKYRTLVDNVSLLKSGLLVEADKLIVESGHAVAGKSLARPCAGAVIPSWSSLNWTDRGETYEETAE